MSSDPGLELRLLRTFATVAERRSFTRAAEELHVAQQAVSQQIRTLERSLGVTLLQRTPRRVELTAEGAVLLVDARRVLAAADRAARRVKAAARGEAGVLRLAYTLTTAWDTLPKLLSRLTELHPEIRVQGREVLGADIRDLLLDEQVDLALAPATSYPRGFRSRTVRREPLRLAVSERDELARARRVPLSKVADRPFQLWPRDMAPGFYDAVVAACRSAGFEPTIDEQATGNIVWGNLARGRGVALINASLVEQLPRGVVLVEHSSPSASLPYDAVWQQSDLPLIDRALSVASQLGKQAGWL